MTDVSGNVWIGPDADVAGYPIRNGEMYNFVLTHPGKVGIGKWNEPADVEELRNQYSDWAPVVQQLLSHVTSCVKWKLASLPPLEKWVNESGRVVILGDAAHAMLPYLGQGAAMSIEDGAALAECLDRVSE
jgi:salicylate hydroxylase